MLGTDGFLIIINITLTVLSELRKSRCSHISLCGDCLSIDRQVENAETETHMQENPPEYE